MAAARASIEGAHPGGAVVVSCQRLEAYGFGPCDCDAPDRLNGYEALERLAAVAAGLESVVLGEDQVTGQVRAAFTGASGELRRLGDIAIATARSLRAETQFESHAGHLLDKALRLSTMGTGGQLLVLGVGAMGKLIAGRAAELGFEVTVAARRQPEHELTGTFVELGRVPSLPPFDVIVGCLGSGAGEIAPRVLPAARLLIDLGTPRNFSALSGPGVIAIADMLEDEQQRPHAVARRHKLRARLGELLRVRLERLGGSETAAIGQLRSEVEAIRQAEVQRALRLHPDVDPAVLEQVTRSLVDKVFHAPTSRLKETRDVAMARALAELFRSTTETNA
jgi:glutamyl-tRNA reductase